MTFATQWLSNVMISPFPIQLNGQPYTAEMPVLNYQGRTYLALREFGTVTNNEIDFINNTIIINSSSTNSTPTVQPETTTVTLGQKNALKKAKSYLDFSSFSKKGLAEQLEYEGFTESETEYAVNNCGANWNEQALKKAESYLAVSSFSKKGLADQLEFEDFTKTEVNYAIDNCGADWYEQAAKKAKSYLSFSSFSRKRLIEQLEFEGFTQEQAEYGVTAVGF